MRGEKRKVHRNPLKFENPIGKLSHPCPLIFTKIVTTPLDDSMHIRQWARVRREKKVGNILYLITRVLEKETP